jgi:hypothetical protein
MRFIVGSKTSDLDPVTAGTVLLHVIDNSPDVFVGKDINF